MTGELFKELVDGLDSGKADAAIYKAVKALGVKHYEVFESGLGVPLDQLNIHSPAYRTAAKLYAHTATFTAAKVNTFARQYRQLSNPIEKAVLTARHAGTWHKAETIAIHRNAQQARKWLEYEDARQLYPSLIYDAILDGRTRLAHLKMDGITLPLRHDFWHTHFPPNGYGCRCDVRQSRAVQTPEREVKRKKRQAYVPPVFKNNSAQSGKLFQNHPYQRYVEALTGNHLEIVNKSPYRAVKAFLFNQKKRITSQQISKDITYTDTTTTKNARTTKNMTVHATKDFLDEMSGQPISNQLLMLNWSQWLNLKEIKIRKVPVRASQGGKGKVKFEEIFEAETAEVIIRFGQRSQSSKVTMYHIVKKRK